MKLKLIITMVGLISIGSALTSCSKPPKDMAYFKAHYSEIRVEAKRCLVDAKDGKSITKDATCNTVAEIGGLICDDMIRNNGNPFGTDCNQYYQRLNVAASGI